MITRENGTAKKIWIEKDREEGKEIGSEQGREGGRKLIAVCCIKSSQFVILNGIIPEFNCFPLGLNAVDKAACCSRSGRGRGRGWTPWRRVQGGVREGCVGEVECGGGWEWGCYGTHEAFSSP